MVCAVDPGEKVVRFGVESDEQPAGREHAHALATNSRLVPQVLDGLQADDDVDRPGAQRERDRLARTGAHARVAPDCVRRGSPVS